MNYKSNYRAGDGYYSGYNRERSGYIYGDGYGYGDGHGYRYNVRGNGHGCN